MKHGKNCFVQGEVKPAANENDGSLNMADAWLACVYEFVDKAFLLTRKMIQGGKFTESQCGH